MRILQGCLGYARQIGSVAVMLSVSAIICSCDTVGPIEISGLAADRFPAWSHDGSKVAYFSHYDSNGTIQRGIYITHANGEGKRFVGKYGAIPQWMPGDSVLVAKAGLGFVTISLESRAICTLNVVSRGFFFSVSADGRYLYFEGETIERIWSTGIYRYEFATDSITPILDGQHPSVSPDGSKLAFGLSGIRVYDLSSGEVNVVAGRPYSFASWFPSSQELLFDDNGGRIYRSDLSSPPSFFMLGMGPVGISPDGNTVLFLGNTPDENDLRHIWASDADGKNLRQFTY